MHFKSILGQAALEEFKEEATGTETDSEAQAGDATTTEAGGDAPASTEGDAATTTDTTAEAGAGEGGAEDTAATTAAEEPATTDVAADATDPTTDAPADTATAGGEEGAPATDDAAVGMGEDGATGEGGESTDAAATGDEAPPAADDAEAASTAEAATAAVDTSGDAEAAVAEVGGDEGDLEAEAVEGELEQVDTIDEQMDDVNGDVEKLADATEALEGLVSVLDVAVQRGGLDPLGAALLRNNLNTVATTLKTKPLVIPALEDMESPSAKIDGAANTKEQIVKFVKRIIETIKQGFVRLGQWIVETYKRLTNAFVAIERRAEKLAELTKTSQMKEGKLDNSALAKKLSFGGEGAGDVLASIDKVGKIALYLNDTKSYSAYMDTLVLCEEMVKSPEKSEEVRGKISEILAKWAKDVESHATNITGKSRADAAESGSKAAAALEGTMQTFTVPLFDGQVLTIVLPATADGMRSMQANIGPAEGSAVDSVDALDQATALKVCARVAEIAKQARESIEGNAGGVKQLNKDIQKHKDTLIGLSNAMLSRGEIDEELGVGFRKTMVFVNTYLAGSTKLPIHAINKALPRNLMAALDYVAASLGGKAAEAEPTKQLAAS